MATVSPTSIRTSKAYDAWVWDRWYSTGGTSATYNIQNITWTGWTTGNIAINPRYTMPSATTTATPIRYRNTVEYRYDDLWGKWEVRDRAIPQVQEFITEEVRKRHEDEMQRRREEMSRLRLEREAREKAHREARAKAHDRGMELLEMILTPEEKLMRGDRDVLVVRGSEGGLYEIDISQGRGVHGNIVEIDEHGCRLGTICVAPRMYLEDGVMPLSDGYIGQYLAIKHKEGEFRTTGNWSYRRECQQPNVPILGERAA